MCLLEPLRSDRVTAFRADSFIYTLTGLILCSNSVLLFVPCGHFTVRCLLTAVLQQHQRLWVCQLSDLHPSICILQGFQGMPGHPGPTGEKGPSGPVGPTVSPEGQTASVSHSCLFGYEVNSVHSEQESEIQASLGNDTSTYRCIDLYSYDQTAFIGSQQNILLVWLALI